MARYRIDPDRSHVWVDARSSLHPIHSTTAGLEGFVELELAADGSVDLTTEPSGRVTLPVIRLETGNRLEDRELQKRLDVRKFPTIQGLLDSVGPAGDEGSYSVKGRITLRGVERPADGEMVIRVADDGSICLEGRSRFDVRDFGLEPPRVLMLRVEPEVDVRVEVVATKEG